MAKQRGTIVVTGATGLQGRNVARQLLADGWHVKGLTRKRQSQPAAALAAQGVEVVEGDMNQPASLAPIFQGAYGVFSVQNPMTSSIDSEIRQGKNVADAAQQAKVQHVVYGSAGIGTGKTGVPSWDSKRVIEAHMRSLGLPLTILRPMAFMELMTDAKFFPPLSTWQVMPQLMGSDRPLVWLSAHDLGVIVAKAFAQPDRFFGQDLALASDVQTIDACRQAYTEALGRPPSRFPMPAWLFERFGFVGKDLGSMWRWLRTGDVPLDTSPTLALHPEAMTVQTWLKTQRPAK